MISGHGVCRSKPASGGPARLRPGGARVGAAWVVLAVLTSVWAAPAAADSYFVLLIEPDERELVTRVQGQTRDLGVRLVVMPDDSADRSAAAEARIAAESGADFVARIERTVAGELEVRLYDAKQRTLRARSVPARVRGDRLGSSAELEAAALVLRGELNALIEARAEAAHGVGGGAAPPPAAASGGTPATTTGAPPTAATPKPTPPRPAPPPEREADEEEEDEGGDEEEPEESEEEEPEPEPEPPSPPLENYSIRSRTWTLRGGVRASLPVEDATLFAAFAGGRVQLFDWLEVGGTISTSFPIELAEQDVRIQVRRHALSLEAFAVIPWGPRLRALFGLDAGVALYARSTAAVPSDLRAKDSALGVSPTLGAQAELQWLLARHWGLAATLGLSVLPQRTRFAYFERGGEREVAALHSVEPLLCVSLFGLFGP